MNRIKKYINWILKGAGMGAANVIPGVSGGTIALITGIFEELIDSIKSFNAEAVKLLFKGRFKAFAAHTNLIFLVNIFLGVAISIISLARLLEFLFEVYPVFVWAFFFGLILASVYFVGRTVDKWNISSVLTFIIGLVIAVSVSFLNPASENEGFFYLMICGVVAICSMILPGLSGSFVLILMGNYQLVVIDAITDTRVDILLPVLLGAGLGLIAFSHLLSYLYKTFKDQTISVLTGFILGSLSILWPWKQPVYLYDEYGEIITKVDGEQVIARLSPVIPQEFSNEILLAIVFAIIGIIVIWFMEYVAGKTKKSA